MSDDKKIAKITENVDTDLLKIAETLLEAIKIRDFEKVKTVLEVLKPEDRKTLLKLKVGEYQETLLSTSCVYRDDTRVAELILDYAQKDEINIVNSKNIFLLSPMHCGVVFHNTKIVARLLTVPGIDVNAQELNGYTPLMWATLDGQSEIVSMLMKHPSIRTEIKGPFGKTAMEMTVDDHQGEVEGSLISLEVSNFE